MAAAGISARTPRSHPVWKDSFRTRGSKPARRKIAMNASCRRGAISRGNTTNSSSASADSGIASSPPADAPPEGARPCALCVSRRARARRRSRGREKGQCRCCCRNAAGIRAFHISCARSSTSGWPAPEGPTERGERLEAGAPRIGEPQHPELAGRPLAWRPRPRVRHPPASAALPRSATGVGEPHLAGRSDEIDPESRSSCRIAALGEAAPCASAPRRG